MNPRSRLERRIVAAEMSPSTPKPPSKGRSLTMQRLTTAVSLLAALAVNPKDANAQPTREEITNPTSPLKRLFSPAPTAPAQPSAQKPVVLPSSGLEEPGASLPEGAVTTPEGQPKIMTRDELNKIAEAGKINDELRKVRAEKAELEEEATETEAQLQTARKLVEELEQQVKTQGTQIEGKNSLITAQSRGIKLLGENQKEQRAKTAEMKAIMDSKLSAQEKLLKLILLLNTLGLVTLIELIRRSKRKKPDSVMDKAIAALNFQQKEAEKKNSTMDDIIAALNFQLEEAEKKNSTPQPSSNGFPNAEKPVAVEVQQLKLSDFTVILRELVDKLEQQVKPQGTQIEGKDSVITAQSKVINLLGKNQQEQGAKIDEMKAILDSKLSAQEKLLKLVSLLAAAGILVIFENTGLGIATRTRKEKEEASSLPTPTEPEELPVNDELPNAKKPAAEVYVALNFPSEEDSESEEVSKNVEAATDYNRACHFWVEKTGKETGKNTVKFRVIDGSYDGVGGTRLGNATIEIVRGKEVVGTISTTLTKKETIIENYVLPFEPNSDESVIFSVKVYAHQTPEPTHNTPADRDSTTEEVLEAVIAAVENAGKPAEQLEPAPQEMVKADTLLNPNGADLTTTAEPAESPELPDIDEFVDIMLTTATEEWPEGVVTVWQEYDKENCNPAVRSYCEQAIEQYASSQLEQEIPGSKRSASSTPIPNYLDKALTNSNPRAELGQRVIRAQDAAKKVEFEIVVLPELEDFRKKLQDEPGDWPKEVVALWGEYYSETCRPAVKDFIQDIINTTPSEEKMALEQRVIRALNTARAKAATETEATTQTPGQEEEQS